jgi:hypothetical protein
MCLAGERSKTFIVDSNSLWPPDDTLDSVVIANRRVPNHLPINTRSLRICEECKGMKSKRYTPGPKRTQDALGPVRRFEEADMGCIWKRRMPIIRYERRGSRERCLGDRDVFDCRFC